MRTMVPTSFAIGPHLSDFLGKVSQFSGRSRSLVLRRALVGMITHQAVVVVRNDHGGTDRYRVDGTVYDPDVDPPASVEVPMTRDQAIALFEEVKNS